MKISEKQIDQLRDLVIELEGIYSFVNFEGRHYDEDGNRNGVNLEMFGDKWKILLFPGDTRFTIEISSTDGYLASGKIHPNDMAGFAYNRYFEPEKEYSLFQLERWKGEWGG